MEEGGESAESNHVEHPMDDSNSPPIQRIVEGRVYGRFPTIDRDSKTKCIASKHPHPTNYTILYMRMAYTNSMPYATLLQLSYSQRLATY